MEQKRKSTSFLVFLLFVVAIVFSLTIYRVYSYFTATATKTPNYLFPNLSLALNVEGGGSTAKQELTQITQGIMPGDTINFNNIKVENTGDDAIYALANLNINITKTNNQTCEINEWYNLNNQKIDATNLSSNNVPATLIGKGVSTSLNFSYTFDGYIFDNTFQNASFETKLTVHAMQPKNIPNYGTISNQAVSAACIMVSDNLGITPPISIDPSDMEYSELLEVEVVQPTTPNQTKVENSEYYNSYNFSVNNITDADEMFVHVNSGEEVYIVPEEIEIDEFLTLLEQDNLPAGTIVGNAETVANIALTQGQTSNVTVITKTTAEQAPQVSVYTEPSGELPAIDESGMVYTKLDYEKVNSQETPTTTTTIPSESTVSSDYGYLKAYHFTVENVSETDTMNVYATGADIVAIAPGYYTLEEIIYYLLQDSLPPGGAAGNGQGFNGITLAPGESFEFTVATQALSDTPPTITVYTEPTENLPFAEDDILYLLNEDGTSYYVDRALNEEITSANIKSEIAGKPVTLINNGAFSGCTNLASVNLGEGVETIESYAFQNCTSLTEITIPNSVTTIYDHAFNVCTNLASVDLGEGVEIIDDSAFFNCTNLTEITIPNSVTTIGSSAFSDCSNLASVNLGEGVETIGNNAFKNCTSLETITIPNSVTTIRSFAFYGCEKLTSITIPNSVTEIEYSAFQNCTSLAEITLNAKEGYVWAIYNRDSTTDMVVANAGALTQAELLTYAKSYYNFKQIPA